MRLGTGRRTRRPACGCIFMSRKSRHGRAEAPAGVDASLFFGEGSESGRRADRKERQLCRQVQEAVGEALSTLDDDVLSAVWVAGVEPAPDASRLAVLVRAPRDADPELVKAMLARVGGYLRTEVAHAITRKRAPTLTFEVLPPEVTI